MQNGSDCSVVEKVEQAVEQTVYIEGSRLTPGLRIADDLKLGRLGRIRLQLALEEAFSIEIPDQAMNRFDTIGDVIRYMRRCSFDGTQSQ